LPGAVGGTLLGVWAGRALGELYLEFYRFPYLDYTLRPQVSC
jgi:putative ABC transport system permease protein